MPFDPAWYVPACILGLVFGSFFNVAIHRWPKEEPKEREWIRTPSRCPKCSANIRWYDNIPLLSFILLRGKCRDCSAPISWRYPAIELGAALLWMLTIYLVSHFGLSGLDPAQLSMWHYVFAIYFASLLMLTVIIDFETGIIPDEISIGFFAGAWLFIWICSGQTISEGWLSSLIGMLALSTFFFVFCIFGGMGFGDVKLAVGLGALFGWKLTIAVAFLGILLGGVVATALVVVLLIQRRYRRGIPIPFGPYIAVSAYICMFFGWSLANWYLSFYPKIGQ
ncbi:prepilin peptidase [bacterium]|nr:prepilin peptidase [bacterium]